MFIITASEVIGFIILVIIGILWSIQRVSHYIEHYGCTHEQVNETSSCDAICRKCGKNLGFIGTWREQHKKEVL